MYLYNRYVYATESRCIQMKNNEKWLVDYTQIDVLNDFVYYKWNGFLFVSSLYCDELIIARLRVLKSGLWAGWFVNSIIKLFTSQNSFNKSCVHLPWRITYHALVRYVFMYIVVSGSLALTIISRIPVFLGRDTPLFENHQTQYCLQFSIEFQLFLLDV